MPITGDLQTISEADFQVLRENKVAEGIFLDYKRDLYDRGDAGKREFLKDVTSFANTAGGHIIIGMSETSGVPTDLLGVNGDLDAEILRLENLLRACIEPRIVGLQMRSVPLANHRYILVIRIPRSWNPPHARLFGGARRYYARNSNGAHEVSVEELRAMFTAGATLFERMHAFRDERVRRISASDTPIILGEPGQMVLHVVPFSSFSTLQTNNLDPTRVCGKPLSPIWSRDFRGRYNFNGYLTISQEENRAGYVQVFRNGIVESAAGAICANTPRGRLLYAEEVEDQVCTNLDRYMATLVDAEIPPPVTVFLTGVRMHGIITVPNSMSSGKELVPHRHPEMFFPAVTLDNYGRFEDYRQALRPIFDALWNGAGYESSLSYGADGQWRRRTQY